MDKELRTFTVPKWIHFIFKILQFFSTKLAGQFVIESFVKVPKFPVHPKEIPSREQAHLSTFIYEKRKLNVFTWSAQEEKKRILLVHGWAGRASQLGEIALNLNKLGHTCVGLDMPGHGLSEGKKSSYIQFHKVLLAFADEQEQKFDALVAHSIGGVASMLAITNGLKVDKFVSLGMPANSPLILASYLEGIEMNDDVKQYIFNHFTNYFKGGLNDFTAVELVKEIDIPGLLIHDENDADVPIAQAYKVHKKWPKSQLKVTSGLGHKKILGDQAVIEAIKDFLCS